MIYLASAFVLMYMMFIAVALAIIANNTDSYTPAEFLFGLTPFMMVADFFFRFLGQQTPQQLIKPYILLPIPRYTCVECFIVSSIVTPNNLLWLAITLPYIIMSVVFSMGFGASLGVLVAFQVIVVINSQWYMLCRTLTTQGLKWWLLPACVYAGVFSLWYAADIDRLLSWFAHIGAMAAGGHPLLYITLALMLWAFFAVNRKVQYQSTYRETSGEESGELKSVSSFKYLDRAGEVGEYLKLEIKSIMRNKTMRSSFIYALFFVTLMSCLISFTDIYDDGFSRKFWVVYNFIIFGVMVLSKVMSAEGNYIDCLMTNKENIIQLLTAKYYLYTALLLIPLLIMLPTVFAGKYTLLMLLGMMFFTAGPIHCMVMQMAVYNKQSMPLNKKLVNKTNVETNWFQLVVSMGSMFAPVIIISLLMLILPEQMAYLALLVAGLAFMALHKLWIRNIYHRFMARRYVNMDGFRSTRQ